MSGPDPNFMAREMQRQLNQLRQILNQYDESQIMSILQWYVEKTMFEMDPNNRVEAAFKKRISGDLAGLVYHNLVSLSSLAASTSGGRATGQASVNAASMSWGNVQQFQNNDQQFPGFTQGLHDMNAVMRSHAVAPEGSFFDLHGSNQGSNLTPVGRPLAEQAQMNNQQLQQFPQQFQSPRIVQGTAAGDVMRVPTPRQNVSSSSISPLVAGDGSSFSSHNANPRERVRQTETVTLPSQVRPFAQLTTLSPKVVGCHFSSNRELFATIGCDNNVALWCTKSFSLKYTLEEHNAMITDVRFCPSTPGLATSSRDRTVRIWDVDFIKQTRNSLLTLAHAKDVMSLDFHPSNQDLICTCDTDQTIYWSLQNNKNFTYKGGATQVRFQPGLGRLLAATATDHISIIDVETRGGELKLQGHKEPIRSVCWDDSGKLLASVSVDMVKIWSGGECIGELKASGNNFYSCVFHPFHSFVVIACYQTILLWSFRKGSLQFAFPAHDDEISSLAVSSVSGLVASASGNHFKFWKF